MSRVDLATYLNTDKIILGKANALTAAMRRPKTKKPLKKRLLRVLPRKTPVRRARITRSKVTTKLLARKPKTNQRHFSHHRHTARVLPHHHTSYPSLIFLTLVLSVFILAFGAIAKSATITVTAAVTGPLPTAPAIITSPLDGATFSSPTITVDGTCSAGYVVKLFRNDVFSGSTLCTVGNTFTIQVTLTAGHNDLEAKIYNLIDQLGLPGNNIGVTYNAPIPPTTTTPSSTPQAKVAPLILESTVQYQSALPRHEIIWPIKISGGTPPYAVSVEWNDGSVDVYSQPTAGTFEIKHTYAQAGSYKGAYFIKVRGSDSQQRQAILQLVALIGESSFQSPVVSSTWPPWFSGLSKRLTVVWPALALALLMLISYIIGRLAGGTIVLKRTHVQAHSSRR